MNSAKFIAWFKKESNLINFFKTNGHIPFAAKKHNVFVRGLLKCMGFVFCWPCCTASYIGNKFKTNKCSNGFMMICIKEAERAEVEWDGCCGDGCSGGGQMILNIQQATRRLIKEWTELLEINRFDYKKAQMICQKIIEFVDILQKYGEEENERRKISYSANKIRLFIILGDYASIVPVAKSI